MELHAIEISSFKRLQKIELLTPTLSVLVGGNNSGKSSLLQGIHFASKRPTNTVLTQMLNG
jgi:predicted ATP-dependent endonuclease of OLD family